MNRLTTRSQRHAEIAYANVLSVTNTAEADDYLNVARGAGSRIRNSGLLAFLAFLLRSEPGRGTYAAHLRASWKKLSLISGPQSDDPEWVIEFVRNALPAKRFLLTRHTLRLAQWHKRFAETLIDKKAANQAGEDPES